MRFWLQSSGWMLLEHLLRLGSGIVMFSLLARGLPVATYGVWTLFIATWGLLEMSREGAISSALLRFASAAEDREFNQICTATGVASVAIAAVFSAAAFCGLRWATGELAQLLVWIPLLSFASA